ncbi:MAG: glycosyltransferase, partial [Rhodovibrionaceae bacterium]
VDLLIAALTRLAEAGLRPSLLLVGDGPERPALERQMAEAGLDGQARFAGKLAAPALAEALNDSRILVVPSRYREPFGIIALEGAACGCFVVGADGGGLEEAIGPCGTTFARGSAAALAETLGRLLCEGLPARDAAACAAHLARHQETAVVERYLKTLGALAEKRP